MKRLAILGASGHGKVVADLAEQCGWEVVFFDDAFPQLQLNGAWRVVGNTADLLHQIDKYPEVSVAIGHNRTRLAKLALLRNSGFTAVTLVHPRAFVSSRAVLGAGVVVFAGAIVNAFANVGDGCILNTLCSVDHDCDLGAGVHISPGVNLAGSVVVGEASWIGIGASVRQLLKIGSDVIVGAGATVVNDIQDSLTVVGVPAKSR